MFSIAGLIRGHRGWSSTNRDRARLGVVLSVIALILGLAIIGGLMVLADTVEEF